MAQDPAGSAREELARAHGDLAESHADLAQTRVDLEVANELAGHLHEALQTSRQIGMAMGVLMERNKITAEQAFDLLRGASSGRNVKLRDIADEVLYSGESPIAR